MATDKKPHFSQNRLQGSLTDASVAVLLDACHKHLVTGSLRVTAHGKNGVIEMRAGAVETAQYGDKIGTDAVGQMRDLSSGDYELSQKLPDMSGALGDSAAFEGDLRDVGLVKIMRHCEDNALSCIVYVSAGVDEAEIHYRLGEIEKVLFNGERDEDKIVDIMQYKNAAFRVAAPPLDLDIAGWPSMEREPTAPFKIAVILEEGRREEAAAVAAQEAVRPAPVVAAPAPAPANVAVAAPVAVAPAPAPAPAPAKVAAPAPEATRSEEPAKKRETAAPESAAAKGESQKQGKKKKGGKNKKGKKQPQQAAQRGKPTTAPAPVKSPPAAARPAPAPAAAAAADKRKSGDTRQPVAARMVRQSKAPPKEEAPASRTVTYAVIGVVVTVGVVAGLILALG